MSSDKNLDARLDEHLAAEARMVPSYRHDDDRLMVIELVLEIDVDALVQAEVSRLTKGVVGVLRIEHDFKVTAEVPVRFTSHMENLMTIAVNSGMDLEEFEDTCTVYEG